jgi:hypothetical protein
MRTKRVHVRRLENLVHAFGSQSAFYQVANSDGANEGGEASILTLLLCCPLLEYLSWAERRLFRTRRQ